MKNSPQEILDKIIADNTILSQTNEELSSEDQKALKEAKEKLDLDICYGRLLPKEKRTPEYREEIRKKYEKEYGKGA